MKLIDTYHHIERREILDCRIKSIKELIRHYGLKLTSYEILLLSEAYTFMYTKIKLPGISLEAFPFATVSHNDLEETYFNNLNIKFNTERIYGSCSEWEYIKILIDQYIPILFKIDSRFIRRSNRDASKDEKLNVSFLSTLLLVGYDEENRDALIVLTNDDEIENVNRIAIDDFQKYRCSQCLPFSPEGVCFYLKSACKIKDISEADINRAILESLKKTTDIMLNDGGSYDVFLGAFDNLEVKKGIYAMQEFKDDLSLMLNKKKYDFDNTNKVIRLMMIFLRNSMMLGSYSAYRSEFGISLKVLANRFNIHEFMTIGDNFEKIAQEWKKFFSLLSTTARMKTDLSEGLEMLIQVWDNIIRGEQRQFFEISKILS